MTLSIADDVALLAIAIERARTPDDIVCCRADFEALWLKYKRDTQLVEDAYVTEAREEMDAQIASDLGEGRVLSVVRGKA